MKSSTLIRLNFNIFQAASSVMLCFGILLQHTSTPPLYIYGCYCNAVCSILWHGYQEAIPQLTPTPFGEFYSSKTVKHSHNTLAILQNIDRAFVCFVLFYGPIPNYFLPLWVIIMICGICGTRDIWTTIIGAISILIDLSLLYKLSHLSQIILVIGYLGGTITWKFTPSDRWVTPYRWIWHTFCSAIICTRSYLLIE